MGSFVAYHGSQALFERFDPENLFPQAEGLAA